MTASAAVHGTSHTSAKASAAVTASLVNGVSGRCMDDPAFATAADTQIALWDCNGGANQRWTTSGSGTVTIGGKCLDVAGGPAGAQTHGTRAVLWACNGSPSQNRTFNGQPAQIRNASGLCLDTAMGVGGNGVPLVVWECVGSKSQAWTLR
ncbi:ricin-type beta-trefoil lectin domain protein [Streptomyces sp. NPDC001205]